MPRLSANRPLDERVIWELGPDYDLESLGTLSGTPGVQTATVTLSSADILDIVNTFIEIIPAPGAGKLILLVSGYAIFRFGTAPYTAGADLIVKPAVPGAFAEAIDFRKDALLESEDGFTLGAVDISGFVGPLSEYEDQAFIVEGFAPDFVDGDGTLDITVMYQVFDL